MAYSVFSRNALAAQVEVLVRLQAVRTMHAPTGLADLEAARRRLAFDELLTLQLSLLLRRKLLQ